MVVEDGGGGGGAAYMLAIKINGEEITRRD